MLVNTEDVGIEGTLMKFVGDTKMSIQKGVATLQEDMDWLQEWASQNLMRFSRDNIRSCT